MGFSARKYEDDPIVTRDFQAATGALNPELQETLVHQFYDAFRRPYDKAEDTHVVEDGYFALLNELGPRNALEHTLAVQIGVGHLNIMEVYKRANKASSPALWAQYAQIGTKMSARFHQLAEFYMRLRDGGNAKVNVEAVTAQSGGQAVVGVLQTAPSLTKAPGPASPLEEPSARRYEDARIKHCIG